MTLPFNKLSCYWVSPGQCKDSCSSKNSRNHQFGWEQLPHHFTVQMWLSLISTCLPPLKEFLHRTKFQAIIKWREPWAKNAVQRFVHHHHHHHHHVAPSDIPNPLLPPFSIVHRSQQVLKVTSCISTELLYVGSSWPFCLCSSMWRGPQEYVTSEFILTFPTVSSHVFFV